MSDEYLRAADQAFADRMMEEARKLRAAAEAAWLPAVKGQLMSRVMEFENAAAVDPRPAPSPGRPR